MILLSSLIPTTVVSEDISTLVDYDLFYLEPLPYFPATCNCVDFTRLFNIGDEPTDEPCVLCAVKTWEGEKGHRAVVWEIRKTELVIVESNYIPCEVSWRIISLDNPLIRGYVR